MIINAIKRSYEIMQQRGWDTIYWAVDLHGVCLKSNYEQGGYTWINPDACRALIEIASHAENKIILWSSVHENEKAPIIEFFENHGIKILGFNETPLEKDNKVSSFKEKFYFSVLLDDKAGFDPDSDWADIIQFYKEQ